MVDPFARAIADFHRGEQDEPLLQRDGEHVLEHPIEDFYFGEFDTDSPRADTLTEWLDGPLVDLGAGVGRDARFFQERFETVAVEVYEALVETMRERGVEDARRADMFALPEYFERDRFRSAHAYGTQVGLAGSMAGLRRFLGDLSFVTTPDATAVLDCYDPDVEGASELLGFRADPTPGMAFRVLWFEYEGVASDALVFRLFSPDRLREATVGTLWDVVSVERSESPNDYHYLAVLEKERRAR